MSAVQKERAIHKGSVEMGTKSEENNKQKGKSGASCVITFLFLRRHSN